MFGKLGKWYIFLKYSISEFVSQFTQAVNKLNKSLVRRKIQDNNAH